MTHTACGQQRAAPAQTFAIEELLRAGAFPHAVGRVEIKETHVSWVVLTGPFAYKIKKPVKLDFIDAATLERRRHLCEEELRLNRRLAPELYVDMVPITRADRQVSVGGAGTVIDYAVRMKQFAAADELVSLLADQDVSLQEIQSLGALLATFHSNAAVARWTGVHVRTRQMYESVLGNLAQLIASLEQLAPPPGLARLIHWTHDSARALDETFLLRERCGYIRECHGDLHAANIVRWQGRLVPFDCLEFDPQLRWIDVMNDIAFLVMDLASRQRTDLAFALLSRYLETTGDYDGIPLLRFYAVYRALVRAKVDALTAAQFPQRAAEFAERLQRRVRTALEWMGSERPALILMHGLSGSGKSWLSERLLPLLPAIRIRSDVERKRLAGVDAQQSAAAGVRRGIYSPEFSHRTYGRLADCAESCLRAGFNVIVDAAFLDAADRELFRSLAVRLRAGYAIVSCQADPATLAARVLERARAHNDPSDAGLAVLDAQLRTTEPFSEPEQACVAVLDISEPHAVERAAQAVQALAGACPGQRQHVE